MSMFLIFFMLCWFWSLTKITMTVTVTVTGRHHNAYFVFGMPNEGEKKYEERKAKHLKYKAHYETLMWMMEELEGGPKMFDWGR